MPQSIRFVRRSSALIATLAGALLAACSDSEETLGPPRGPRAATLQVISRDPPIGLAGYQLPDSIVVRAVDAQGRGVAGILVKASTPWPSHIILDNPYTDAQGYAQLAWYLVDSNENRARIEVDGAPAVELRPRLLSVPDVVRPMAGLVGSYVPLRAAGLERDLPRNLHIEQWMRAKITLLRTPGIGGDAIENRRWEIGNIRSRSGTDIPVVAMFPQDPMRAEAAQAIRVIERHAPVLEEFFDMAVPAPPEGAVRLWYGWVTGMSGGGGMVSVEDRTMYEMRNAGRLNTLPYDAGITHELGHSFVGTEALTQLLEIYGYNMAQTGSRDIAQWTYTRGWKPQDANNFDVHALLDVYQLIGPDAMARAFRAVVPLRPRYGEALTPAVQQAFIDAAPEAVRAQVAAKVARVRY